MRCWWEHAESVVRTTQPPPTRVTQMVTAATHPPVLYGPLPTHPPDLCERDSLVSPPLPANDAHPPAPHSCRLSPIPHSPSPSPHILSPIPPPPSLSSKPLSSHVVPCPGSVVSLPAGAMTALPAGLRRMGARRSQRGARAPRTLLRRFAAAVAAAAVLAVVALLVRKAGRSNPPSQTAPAASAAWTARYLLSALSARGTNAVDGNWPGGTPGVRLAAATARLAAGDPPPFEVFGDCVNAPARRWGWHGGNVEDVTVGVVDVLGGGCCKLVLPGDQGSGGDVSHASRFHETLVTRPEPSELARRAHVKAPQDADAVFSVVDAFKDRLYTPVGGGHGLARAEWTDEFSRRWDASVAIALDGLGFLIPAHRVAAAAARAAASAAGKVTKERLIKDLFAAAALTNISIPHTHYRLNAAGGEVWIFDVVGSEAASPLAKTAAARTATASPPHASKPSLLAWKVVVSRPLPSGTGAHVGCTIEVFPRNPTEHLTLIVPYSSRPARLTAFLAAYKRLVWADPEVSLMVSTLSKDVKDVVKAVTAAGLPHTPHPNAGTTGLTRPAPLHINGVSILTTSGDRSGAFSRSVAIREAVKRLPTTALFFVTDVDLEVKVGAVRNCRSNALIGGQAWFPIFWSFYAATKPVLTASSGFWRTSSYGPVCVHKNNWDAVGGFGGNEERRYVGWGSEDVDLYSTFQDSADMAVMRGLEPNLFHAWHGKACAHNMAYAACVKTVAMSMASQERLAQLVVETGVDVAAALGVKREVGGGMG